jgi:GcrA cell cycle regulator
VSGSPWTPELRERVARLWAEGLSATKIAVLSGPAFTRNSIIGFVHRQNLSGRITQSAMPRARKARAIPAAPKTEAAKPASSARVKPPVAHIQAAPVAQPEPVPEPLPPPPVLPPIDPPKGAVSAILGLGKGMCKWPIGDPFAEDFHFCCQPWRNDDGPYCAAHSKEAWRGDVTPEERARREVHAEMMRRSKVLRLRAA